MLELTARVRTDQWGYGDQQGLHLETRDVCAGGAFFATDGRQPLVEGARVQVEIVLPVIELRKLLLKNERMRIQLTGSVVRSSGDGVAVRFGDDFRISPANLESGWVARDS